MPDTRIWQLAGTIILLCHYCHQYGTTFPALCHGNLGTIPGKRVAGDSRVLSVLFKWATRRSTICLGGELVEQWMMSWCVLADCCYESPQQSNIFVDLKYFLVSSSEEPAVAPPPDLSSWMLLVAETKYYGFSAISENWGDTPALTRLLQIIHKCSLGIRIYWSLNKFTIEIKISKLE